MPDAAHQTTGGNHKKGNDSSVVAFPRSTQERPLHNLPLELSSFVGREQEGAEVKRLLLEEKNRLLTLTGSGGCGKTRLALAVAVEVVENFEEGGVWWVELANLSDPNLVAPAVAAALGVREASGRSLTEMLVEHLNKKPNKKKTLLVLDNCEHLIDACATLSDTLLRACPTLQILATSREALRVAGERAWLVPSLSLPDTDLPLPLQELRRYEAVDLFVERATQVTSRFEVTEENASAVARLCRRLDGVPLALELAAARTKVLCVGQILARLEDSLKLLTMGSDRTAPTRQRTLRGTLDWSYQLLSEQERKLFGRLSTFAGGWTLEAAEAVGAGDGIEEGEVLELLSRLVDKSLVVFEAGPEHEARYGMLEPVRQYGRERLEERGETEQEVRERHARYYLTLAEGAEAELRNQEAWLERLEKEHGNFRAALSWALDEQDTQHPEEEERAQLGLRLAAALSQGRFWAPYGPSEGHRWLERGLARSGAAPTSLRAKALNQAGWLAIYLGHYQQAVALLEEGLALFKEMGDTPGAVVSLAHLGHMALHGGDRERASMLGREAEALRQELADRQVIAFLLIFLSMVALVEGDRDRSVELSEESLALHRELGDLRGTAMCLTILGITALERGDAERAAVLYEEDMHILRGLRDKTGTSYGLRGLAGVATLQREPIRAARLWGADEALREAIGLPLSYLDRSHPDHEGLLAAARSQLDEVAWEAAQAEGRAMTPEQAVEYALKVEEEQEEPEEEQAPPGAPSTSATTTIAPPPSYPGGLSAREAEVLKLVAKGLTDAQVAEKLFISPRTVSGHLTSVYDKLGVNSRPAATRFAAEHDLL